MEQANLKAVRGSKNSWQLDGESTLEAITIPERPKKNAPTVVRVTHGNVYGPMDEVEFCVRTGDPENPTDQDDLDSAVDWIPMRLVEELLLDDESEEWQLRPKGKHSIDEEVCWEGTYEAELALPSGIYLLAAR